MSDGTPPMVTTYLDVGGRRAGKTSEAARRLASRTRLQYSTVMDLLAHGWTYTEDATGMTWTQG
jgi:hypothetical protein